MKNFRSFNMELGCKIHVRLHFALTLLFVSSSVGLTRKEGFVGEYKTLILSHQLAIRDRPQETLWQSSVELYQQITIAFALVMSYRFSY